MRIYLGGKMGGRLGSEVLSERDRARQACYDHGLIPVDPARGENVDPNKHVDLKMDYVTMKAFVAKDEYAIKTCDVLLILTGDTPSEGTLWEAGFAHFKLGIPVIMVSPARVKGELMGFSNIKVDAMFSTIEGAVSFIASNYAV